MPVPDFWGGYRIMCDEVELWGGLLALATAAGVYAWPNQPPNGQPADPGMSEQDPEAGVTVLEVCLVVLVVLVVLLILGFI